VTEVVRLTVKLSVLAFVVTSLLTMGLSLKPRDILAPLRRPRLLLLALAANFGLVPAIAYLLTEVIPLDRSHAIGLLLLGGAAGAPFLPKLAELARGDLAFSVALMILLVIGSAVFLPLALPLLIPGLQADAWGIARPLLVLMVLPLVIGLVLKSRFERLSVWLQPVLGQVSNVSLVLLTILFVGSSIDDVVGTLGSGAPGVAGLFALLSLAAGYALGGPEPATRRVLGLGTGQRNIAAALVTATSNFSDPKVVVMLLVATLVGLVVLLTAAVLFRGRPAPLP
jgi:predicted Na+-dependent transporter